MFEPNAQRFGVPLAARSSTALPLNTPLPGGMDLPEMFDQLRQNMQWWNQKNLPGGLGAGHAKSRPPELSPTSAQPPAPYTQAQTTLRMRSIPEVFFSGQNKPYQFGWDHPLNMSPNRYPFVGLGDHSALGKPLGSMSMKFGI